MHYIIVCTSARGLQFAAPANLQVAGHHIDSTACPYGTNICDLWYRRVDIPSYQCKPGETIGVHSQKQSKALVESWADASSRPMPAHLSRSSENTGAQVTSIVNRQDVALSINELLIVEYYSRKM